MNSPFYMARFFAQTSLMFKSFSQLLVNPNVPPTERDQFIDVLKNTITEIQGFVDVLENAQNEEKNGICNRS